MALYRVRGAGPVKLVRQDTNGRVGVSLYPKGGRLDIKAETEEAFTESVLALIETGVLVPLKGKEE